MSGGVSEGVKGKKAGGWQGKVSTTFTGRGVWGRDVERTTDYGVGSTGYVREGEERRGKGRGEKQWRGRPREWVEKMWGVRMVATMEEGAVI